MLMKIDSESRMEKGRRGVGPPGSAHESGDTGSELVRSTTFESESGRAS